VCARTIFPPWLFHRGLTLYRLRESSFVTVDYILRFWGAASRAEARRPRQVVIRNGAVLHAAPPDYTELDYTPFSERIPVAQPPGEPADAAAKVANGGHRADSAPGGIGDSVALASRRKLQRAFSGFYESDLFPVRRSRP